MIIKEAIGIDGLLFNIGKHLFKSESDLAAWKKEWLDKGVIGKTSRDMVELVYTKEHKGQDKFRKSVYNDVPSLFVYYKKTLTEPRTDWDERYGSVGEGPNDKEVIKVVNDLNKVRELIDKDIKGDVRYIDQVKVFYCGELLPFDIILNPDTFMETTFTMISFVVNDIEILEDHPIYIDFNMHEIEHEGKIIYCSRDLDVVGIQQMRLNYELGSYVKIINNKRAV